MAERSVFVGRDVFPFCEEIKVQFEYFQGFALCQKRKSQISIHENFKAAYPEEKVLEVSSSSLYSLGAKLSAMELKKKTKNGTTCVESAFQSSRVYESNNEIIGPFINLLFLPGRECKKKVRALSEGFRFSHYNFEGLEFWPPSHHPSLFYDFLYINSLIEPENRDVAEQLISSGYTAFTDLATKSVNTQARSCAIFLSLVRNGLITYVTNQESFLSLFDQTSYENIHLTSSIPVVPCKISRAEVEKIYTANCQKLTNSKSADNFLDLKQ